MKLIKLDSEGKIISGEDKNNDDEEEEKDKLEDIFDSPITKNMHCYAACLERDIQQITVLDVYMDKNWAQMQHENQSLPVNKINFVNDVSEDMKVLISNDC